MKTILGYVLITAPFLFLWLGLPALMNDERTTYLEEFKITSGAILFAGLVLAIVSLGVYLVTGS